MLNKSVLSVPDLVDVVFVPELNAVHLKWFSEYDEDTRVQNAVHAALDFVRSNDVEHWVVDVSMSTRGLSDADYAWVSSDAFRDAIRNTPLRKFALLPPLPDSGQDDAWVREWEEKTLANFGEAITARVCDDLEDAWNFLSR